VPSPIRRPVSLFQKKQLTNLLLIAGNVEFPSRVKCVVLVPNTSNQQLLKLPSEMSDCCTFVANKPLTDLLKPTCTSCIVTGPLLAVEDVTKSPMPPFQVPFWLIDKLAILNEHPAPRLIDNPPADVANICVVPLPAPLIVIS